MRGRTTTAFAPVGSGPLRETPVVTGERSTALPPLPTSHSAIIGQQQQRIAGHWRRCGEVGRSASQEQQKDRQPLAPLRGSWAVGAAKLPTPTPRPGATATGSQARPNQRSERFGDVGYWPTIHGKNRSRHSKQPRQCKNPFGSSANDRRGFLSFSACFSGPPPGHEWAPLLLIGTLRLVALHLLPP